MPSGNDGEGSSGTNHGNNGGASSTWRVLCKYPAVRWYILTCICKDAGDWLVRVANLLVVQDWAGTGTALSYLVLSSLLPKALLAPIGGLIADRFDRRHMMVLMDTLAGLVVLGFLVAVAYKSVAILFIVTSLRSAISAIYYPITYGLLPLMVPNDQDMQYAGSIATSVYGLMSMLGGLVAGSTAALIGMTACYVIDSSTYLISAIIMCTCVHGNFRGSLQGSNPARDGSSNNNKRTVEESTTELGLSVDETLSDEAANALEISKATMKQHENKKQNNRCNTCLDTLFCGAGTTVRYLVSSGCGVLVFLKATDSLIWGPGDVIGIEIATVRNEDGSENEDLSAYRMGLYYCCSGLGVFLGPTLANWFSNAGRPVSLQRSCIFAMLITVTGWIMSAHAPTYTYFLLSQWWSGLGYGILWAYSSLLLQILIEPAMLGRVLSLEYFFYVIAEMITSSVTGPLYDQGYSTRALCYFGAMVAFISLLFWSSVHACSLGAARPLFNPDYQRKSRRGRRGRDHDDATSVASFSDVPFTKGPAMSKDQPSSPGSSKSIASSGSLLRRKNKTAKTSNQDVEHTVPHGPTIPKVIGANDGGSRDSSPLSVSSQRAPRSPAIAPPPHSFPKPAAQDIAAALAFEGGVASPPESDTREAEV